METGLRTRNHTIRARPYCIYAFRSGVCMQHGIKKVTKLLNALFDEVPRHHALLAWP